MKIRFPAWMLLLYVSIAAVLGRDTALLDRSRHLVQPGAAEPAADPVAPFRVSAIIPGFGIGGATGTLMVPGGGKKSLASNGGALVFAADFATESAALSAFPEGDYTLSLSIFGADLSGTVAVARSAYPPIPWITNPQALQGIDADQDLNLETAVVSADGADDADRQGVEPRSPCTRGVRA